jgi:NADPH:quinone reductase-like Zn-dependent oxidoreductase
MKAVIIKRYGGPEVLELVDLPDPKPGDDEVIIQVAATSVNPVDWLVRDGGAKAFVKIKFPVVLGCDLAGKVVEVGANVKRFAIGDEVFAMMPHDWGAHAERVALAEHLVVKKPAGLTMNQAAAIPVVAMTALVGLRKHGGIQPGERVLVNGASSAVGLSVVQIAKAMGATVIAVCSKDSFPLVQRLGADEVIDYKATDFTRQDARYDVVYDCIGNHPHGECTRVLQGRRVHVTTMPGLGTFLRQFMNPLRRVKVFGLITRGAGEGLEYIRTLVDEGKLQPIIDKTYALAEVAAAQEYSKGKRARGKIILEL